MLTKPQPNYSTALSTFRRAIDVSQQIGALHRAGQAALTLVQEIGQRLPIQETGRILSGRGLNEEVRALEHDLLKHALEVNEGSITRAASNIGVSYQELHYMLNNKDLLKVRTPARRRPRKK